MRIRFAALFVTFAAVPLLAQLDPLPPVTPKLISEPPLVVLAVEPEPAVIPEATLSSTAHANDFASFDALFRARPAEAYRPLHQLWTYSVTDPIGAFYGPAMYEQFARAYPRFAGYIAEFRIVDSRGNVFYPSSETRAFLLAQAEGGVVTSRATVASAQAPPAPGGLRARRSTRAKARPATIAAAPRPLPPPEPAPAPARAPLPLPPPVVAVAAPPVVVPPEPAPASEVPEKQDHASGRGLLLLIIGLIGTGVLALIVRAPREIPSIRNP